MTHSLTILFMIAIIIIAMTLSKLCLSSVKAVPIAPSRESNGALPVGQVSHHCTQTPIPYMFN